RADRRHHAARAEDRAVQPASPSDSRAVQAPAGAPHPVQDTHRLMGLLRAIMRRPLADTALVAHAVVAHGAVAVLLRLAGLRGVSACLARASRGRTTAVPRQTEA